MRHFCTYFDVRYLTRGLALYASLRRHCCEPFLLWILCFDEFTYEALMRLNLEGVRLIGVEDFEVNDPDLRAVKGFRSPVEYYWTSTPCLPLHIFRQDSSAERVTYLDADLFFFGDPAAIFEEMASGSILITEHRYAAPYEDRMATAGRFNVSLLSFRRDANGLACLEWWRARCLEWCFARYEDGKFGDQLYLDDWPDRFGGVVILQHKGAGLAPWNIGRYRIQCSRTGVTVERAPLIFYHFHGCRQVRRSIFQPMDAHYCPQCSAAVMRAIYFPYVWALDEAWRSIRKTTPLAVWQNGRAVIPLATVIRGLLNQELLWVTRSGIGAWVWRVGGELRKRAGNARVLGAEGLGQYREGNLTGARGRYLAAAGVHPSILANRHVWSVLFRSLRPFRAKSWKRP